MRTALIALLILIIATASLGYDLGSRAPAKPAAADHQAPPPDADVIRQGGDTLADAILVDVPGSASGTTMGYNNDYDEACPYDTSTAPDVVYKLAPIRDIRVDIDMLGSTYDTKIYVYREDFTLVACNDDYYSDYVSKLEDIALDGDVKYFLVIDGYEEAAGDYVLTITEFVPCVVDCYAGAQLEGEPPLVDGYEDFHNGGCNTDGATPFGSFWGPIFCGVSGWFISSDGGQNRDTDWYELQIPYSGYLEIIGDAEFACFMFELGPQDCGTVAVIQQTTIGPCAESSMTITGSSGSTVWFWVGPTVFDGTGEFDYVLYTNIYEPNVRTETQTWSAVKGMFSD